MARSTRNTTRTSTTRTPAPTPTPTGVVMETRSISNYNFEYRRDRVSRRAGSSYFNLVEKNGATINMSLAEAKSLYNFLDKALNPQE